MELKCPEGWQLASLHELGEVNRGRSRHRPRYAEHLYGGPYPFIQTGDVKASKGRVTSFTQTYSEAGLAQSRLWPEGTMCITIAANIAETGILTFPACFPDSVVGFIPEPKKADVQFVEYMFRFMRSRIQHQATGSVQDNINIETLERLRFPLPPLAEQKAIAAVLGSLDDKIELNRRMNATLEAMARALFRSWFVDFDPVRAKLDGRQPVGVDKATAELFPDSFEDSELGQISKGWSAVAIERLCDTITSGGTPPRANKSYWEPATVPWFKTGELLDGPLIDAEEKISEEGLANSSCKLWPAGTILFALYASPTVGRFGVLTKPGTANQAAAALIAKPAYGVPFLMGLLYEARAELQRVAVGAAQQNINQGVLKSHVVVAPPPALAKAYSEKVAPWFQQRIQLAEQSRTLATLRDTLLPKLLSGELRVAGVESKLEAA
jgi:type I restriction enzyme S subunit